MPRPTVDPDQHHKIKTKSAISCAMTRPLLSVVTINLNNKSGLLRTLASLKQFSTDERVELICVDGESTDGSVEVAKAFYAPICFVSEQDAGIYDAMNKGLAMARGEFVIWMNSGDCFVDEAHFVLDYLTNAPQSVSVIAFDSLRHDGSATIRLRNESKRMPRMGLFHQSTVYRTNTVIACNGYSLKYPVVADRELTFRIWRHNKNFIFPQIPLSVVEPPGASSNSKRLLLDYLSFVRDYGLISRYFYYASIARVFGYHSLTLPIWRLIKKTAPCLACIKKPSWIIKILGDPALTQ